MFHLFKTSFVNIIKNVTSVQPVLKKQIEITKSPFLNQQFNLSPLLSQIRSNWGYKGRMMLKDIKRRELLRKYAPERIRLQNIRRNNLLPQVLKV